MKLSLAYGTVGSMIEEWKNNASAERQFILNIPHDLRELNIAQKNVCINTKHTKVATSVFLKRLIQLGIKKGTCHGHIQWLGQGLKKRLLVVLKKTNIYLQRQNFTKEVLLVLKIKDGRVTLLVIAGFIHGFIGLWVKQLSVLNVEVKREFIGRTKVMNTCEISMIGNNFVQGAISSMTKSIGVKQLNYGN